MPHCGFAVGTSPEGKLSQGRGDGLNRAQVRQPETKG